MTRLAWKTGLFMAGAVALTLAACKDDGSRSAAAPSALAVLDPSAGLLPPAPPAPVARYEPAQGYRWAERAYGVQRAVYDTPPDYGFAYGEEEPLAWETADDWSMYAEPWDDGYRYYYYQPGATYPYFVRDDDYGYGYDRGGTLVVVVDAAGRYLPAEEYRRVAPIAGRYYAHGRDLRRAGLQAQRTRVDERTWAARAPRVTQGADRWLAAARDDSAWRQWRETDRNRELDRFTPEQVRRAEARRARVGDPGSRDDIRRDDLQREQARREDDQRRLAEQRLREDQARAADRQGRNAAARAQAERQAQAERASLQRAEADRQQRARHDAREVQAHEDRARRQQADARQREQHQAQQAQAKADHGRQMQADAQQRAQRQAQQAEAKAAHDRQQHARAQNDARRAAEQAQAREAHDRQAQAQNAQRAQQDQARAAEQHARGAAAQERASGPPRPQEHARPNGKPDGRGKDKDKKD